MSIHFIPFSCPACKQIFNLSASQTAKYCPFCGYSLKIEQQTSSELLFNRYSLIEKIGKGGMGEVYLANDLICGRKIALKRIRSDLVEHPQIRHRFLKEAHITCQLTHPAIIPIFSIQENPTATFYTMPFVEGETLKQIIRKGRQSEKKGAKPDLVGCSIPTLMRIFITICQATAYAHSKKIIHRDLKLENIIIGKYGEVLILDWGLAKYIDSPEDESCSPDIQPPFPEDDQITRVGKVVGTIAYMAPERALGNPATIQTDIYSLGVILYQLLTLRSPFKRGTLSDFKKIMHHEELIDPVAAAPYRDVPKGLAEITKKALSIDLQTRYHSVNEIICELETYLGGRSDWFQAALLDPKCKRDWEFQENILIAEHIAITPSLIDSEWVNMMVSRQSFAGNIRIQTSICFGEKAEGIGILMSIPEASQRTFINEGYCLWIGSDLYRTTRLLRSNVELIQAPDIYLKRHQWNDIRIEKVDRTIHLYLNNTLQFSYIAQIPLLGTHIGILSKDVDFSLLPLSVSVGSLNLTVNCLAVPDAFLAHKDFAQALSEYQRIAYSFPDRVEGREAIFRSGLTFIEQAKEMEDLSYLELALEEFEKLHKTPGGPLEYLGKALVYQFLGETVEEIKCFELAYRRYPHHPLLHVLQEQILSRMHELSRKERVNTYRFVSLAVRHFNSSSIDAHTKRLLSSLQKNWEPLPFIEEHHLKNGQRQLVQIAIPLAFWLDSPFTLGEILDNLIHSPSPSLIDMQNIFASILVMGGWKYALDKLKQIQEKQPSLLEFSWKEIELMIACHEHPLEEAFLLIFSTISPQPNFSEKRKWLYAINQAIDRNQSYLAIQAIERIIKKCELSFDIQLKLNGWLIWAYLREKNRNKAKEIFDTYPSELLTTGSTPLHFLFGCWLNSVEGEEAAKLHFMNLAPATYPRSWTLACYELTGELTRQGWQANAFTWERRQLYRQLTLFYHCSSDEQLVEHFEKLYQKTFIS